MTTMKQNKPNRDLTTENDQPRESKLFRFFMTPRGKISPKRQARLDRLKESFDKERKRMADLKTEKAMMSADEKLQHNLLHMKAGLLGGCSMIAIPFLVILAIILGVVFFAIIASFFSS
jgi:hypothetical protein